MKVGVPKEIAEDETRVGLVPETVGKLVKDGFEVLVETGAGRNYNIDENYEESGAKIASDAGEVYGEADPSLVLRYLLRYPYLHPLSSIGTLLFSVRLARL